MPGASISLALDDRSLRGLRWTGAAGAALLGGYLGGMGAHLYLALLLAALLGAVACTRPAPFLLAYLLYMPFEEFVLKWTPDGLIYLALRYGPELALYGMLAGLLLTRAAAGARPVWRRTPVDAPLAMFLAVAAISAFLAEAPPLLVAHGLRWLLRYLIVFYLVVHLDWNNERAKLWIRLLLGVAAVQVILATLQSVLGRPAWEFLAPDYGKRGDADVVKWDPNFQRGVFATMGSYFALGTYLGMWTLLCLAWGWVTRRRGWLLLAAGLGFGLLLSYSRQAVLGLMLGALALAAMSGRRRLVAGCLILIMAYFGIGAWVYLTDVRIPTSNVDRPLHERFLGPFTREYWRIDYTFGGRSYLLLEVGGRLLGDAPLLGQGPGMFGTRASLIHRSPVYEKLKIDTRNLFDVYWISVLGQVGILGLLAFLAILVRVLAASVGRAGRAEDPWERGLALGLAAVLTGVILSSFFGPTLSDRYLSLFVWFLAGLVLAPRTAAAQ